MFREDVIEATKLILRMIRHDAEYLKSPLVKDELKEKVIYTTVSVGDPEAITSRLRTAFEAAGFPLSEKEIKQVETGYSSVHLVAYVNVQVDSHLQKVPIEIQIRTVFEDAWGEIDHKLRYSENRERGPTPKAFLESWQPHLNVLKTFTDGCAQYAGIIKNHAIDARNNSLTDFRPLKPVETVEDALAQMGEVSPDLKKAFDWAYEKRKAATDAQQ